MAITKQSLRDLFTAYERTARTDARKHVRDRDAVSKNAPELFLTPEKLKRGKRVTVSFRALTGISVQDLVAAYASMGVKVQVNQNSLTFSPDDLRRLVQHDSKRKKRFDSSEQGISYNTLIRASTQKDKERAKTVRNAMYYGRKGDTMLFQVTGNSKPHYRVRLRLEGWRNSIVKGNDVTMPPLLLARKLLSGYLSIDCTCGRHQFWYRYLACVGNYAIEPPLERDFPKIRNPTLTGCCCKHVLKVLSDCKSNRVQFFLAKEIEKARKNPGTVGAARTNIMGARDLRMARVKRLSQDAIKVFRRYEKEVEQLKKNIRPKKTPIKQLRRQGEGTDAPKVSKEVLNAIKTFLKLARAANMKPDTMLNQLAKAQRLTRAQIDAIIKEHNL